MQKANFLHVADIFRFVKDAKGPSFQKLLPGCKPDKCPDLLPENVQKNAIHEIFRGLGRSYGALLHPDVVPESVSLSDALNQYANPPAEKITLHFPSHAGDPAFSLTVDNPILFNKTTAGQLLSLLGCASVAVLGRYHDEKEIILQRTGMAFYLAEKMQHAYDFIYQKLEETGMPPDEARQKMLALNLDISDQRRMHVEQQMNSGLIKPLSPAR